MITFEELLVRADVDVLQQLLGAAEARLLDRLDPELSRPSRLRSLISEFRTPLELLREPSSRAALMLLLPWEDARYLATLLGAGDGDPYAYLSTLKLRRGSRTEDLLLAAFHIYASASTEAEIESTPAQRPVKVEHPLFTHQRRAARQVTARLEAPERRRVLLHMPTGSGKTRTSMHVIVDFLRRNEPALVTWLAYSEELCEQAAAEFEAAWAVLGNRELSVSRYFGERDVDVRELYDGLLVAGLGKLSGLLRRDIGAVSELAACTRLTVFDEAHQATAPTYKLIIDMLIKADPKAAFLGLSATPGRSYSDVALDEQLADVFYRQKVTLTVDGYANPIDYLIESGYLARPTFKTIPFAPDGFSEKEIRRIADALELPTSIIEKLATDEQRNLLLLGRIENLLEHHSRVLAFAANVQHATLLATVLRARGIDAVAVTGTTNKVERERVIHRFKSASARPMVLCNFGVLTTGFDAPRTSAAVIGRPTKSLVLYSQMVGRVLRGPAAGGNEHAEIWTVVDTIMPGFGSIAEAFTNWEDVWQ